jgi:hypothetical protein
MRGTDGAQELRCRSAWRHRTGGHLSRRRLVLGEGIRLLTAQHPTREDVEEWVGKAVFISQFNRNLLSIFGEIFSGSSLSRQGPLTLVSGDEVLTFLMLLPMFWRDLRLEVSGVVTATDASPSGGGACISFGLTPKGLLKLSSLESPVHEDASRPELLVVSLFSGM